MAGGAYFVWPERQKKNRLNPQELFSRYREERQRLEAKLKLGEASAGAPHVPSRKKQEKRRARLYDLDERLIPNLIKRLAL